MIEKLERLSAAGIHLLDTGIPNHYVFERDGFVALVERKGEAFGNIGAPAKLVDSGVALLVWRAGKAFFVNKGFEQEAAGSEVAALRSFDAELRQALA